MVPYTRCAPPSGLERTLRRAPPCPLCSSFGTVERRWVAGRWPTSWGGFLSLNLAAVRPIFQREPLSACTTSRLREPDSRNEWPSTMIKELTHDPQLWRQILSGLKSPSKYRHGDELMQAVAAFVINIYFLWIAVLAQFWVVCSLVILYLNLCIVWNLSLKKITPVPAMVGSLILVGINYGALILAPLGQFWVIGSVILATWQFKCLLVIARRQRSEK